MEAFLLFTPARLRGPEVLVGREAAPIIGLFAVASCCFWTLDAALDVNMCMPVGLSALLSC
jgi:hypothetical protein